MQTSPTLRDPVRLPSGRHFAPFRPRSAGVLDPEELAWCRAHGVALGIDPLQQGRVVLGAPDDLTGDAPAPAAVGAAPAPSVRLAFRAWRQDEAPLYRALLDDPELWRFLPEPCPNPLTEADAAALLALAASAPHHEVRAVEADGEVIGQARLAFLSRSAGPGEAEISYWLGRGHRGRGLGRALVAAFSAEAFRRHPGLAALVARVHRDNLASARALLGAGYRAEGPAPDDPAVIVYRLFRPA